MIQTVTRTEKESRHGRGDTKIVKLATGVARMSGEIAETRVNHSLPRPSQNLRRVHRLSLNSEHGRCEAVPELSFRRNYSPNFPIDA